MVHSEEDYNAAVDASNILFGNATSDALKKLDEDTLLAVFEGVPQFEVSKDAVSAGVKAVDLFTDNAAVFASKGEMRKLVQGGGVSLNKEKLEAFDQVITSADLLDEKYLLVQRGKKNYYLIIAKYLDISGHTFIFAPLFNRKHPVFVPWCNGSTTVFGSVCLSSNLGGTTKMKELYRGLSLWSSFFVLFSVKELLFSSI